MPSSGLRESLDVLDARVADGVVVGFGTRVDAETLPALKKLRARRRGEFSCPVRQLGYDTERPEVEF
jgi:hypothetical protein